MELPFTSPLVHGFGHGKSLTIRGRPHHNNAWVAVTLMNGVEVLKDRHDNPTKQCPLQVQARLDDNVVVLNTHDGRSWGQEEKTKPGFVARADVFNEIKIVCNQNLYEVYFNGKLFTKYNHRVDSRAVTHFSFYGDFKVHEIIYA